MLEARFIVSDFISDLKAAVTGYLTMARSTKCLKTFLMICEVMEIAISSVY